MNALAEIVKAFLLPGSLSLLLLLTSLGVVMLLLGGRWRAIARVGLSVLVAGYWLISVPWFAGALVGLLGHGYSRIESPSKAQEVQAIVVLGGGAADYQYAGGEIVSMSDASALRVLEAARLYRLLHPDLVIASGGPGSKGGEPEGEVMARALVELGVPASAVVTEIVSSNTRDQAIYVQRMLAARGVVRFALVTSPVHMPRAMGAFRKVGLKPLPDTAPEQNQAPGAKAAGWLPSLSALSTSQSAFREILGLGYYWARGWLAAAPLPTVTVGVLGAPSGS